MNGVDRLPRRNRSNSVPWVQRFFPRLLKFLQLLSLLGNRSYNKIPPAGIGNAMFLPGSNKRRLAPPSLALPLRDFAAGASRKLSV